MRGARGLAAAAALALLLSSGADAAWAAPTTEVVQGRVLRLVSVADWTAASSLRPGETVQWDVAVSADAPDPGRVTLALSARGDAPLVVEATLCMRAWEGDGCPGGAVPLESGWSIPRDGTEIALAAFAADEVAHLRLRVALAADAGNAVTDLRVHARGAGESVTTGPEGATPAGTLAATGGGATMGAIGGGAVLGLVGAGLLSRRRRASTRETRAEP